MRLLAIDMQKAGLAFISAKAVHSSEGRRIHEIVCETSDDAARANAWAKDSGYDAVARVATEEELAEHRRWQELA